MGMSLIYTGVTPVCVLVASAARSRRGSCLSQSWFRGSPLNLREKILGCSPRPSTASGLPGEVLGAGWVHQLRVVLMGATEAAGSNSLHPPTVSI